MRNCLLLVAVEFILPIRKLRHLTALARAGNFTRAAKVLHLSQPALSRSIDTLEAELGVRLVERAYGQVKLTPAGRLTLERAQHLLEGVERLRRDVAHCAVKGPGCVRVGLGPFAAFCLGGLPLGRLIRRYPGLVIEVETGDAPTLNAQLEAGQIDLFIADTRGLPSLRQPAGRIVPAWPVAFQAHPSHPLVQAGRIALDRLLDYPVAGPRLPAFALRFFQQQLTGCDASLFTLVCDDMAQLTLLAQEEEWVVLAPCLPGRMALRSLDIEGLDGGMSAHYRIVVGDGREQLPAVQLFVDMAAGELA